MTPTQQFIEDAIAGGWESRVLEEHLEDMGQGKVLTRHDIGWIFTVPEIWQAVGKTRGWSEPKMMKAIYEEQGIEIQATGAFAQQLHFNALLIDGKTIDEALAAISQGV